jgi:hypothetical protein
MVVTRYLDLSLLKMRITKVMQKTEPKKEAEGGSGNNPNEQDELEEQEQGDQELHTLMILEGFRADPDPATLSLRLPKRLRS